MSRFSRLEVRSIPVGWRVSGAVVFAAIALGGCQPAQSTPTSEAIVARTIAALEQTVPEGKIAYSEYRLERSDGTTTTSADIRESLDWDGRRERVDVERSEVASSGAPVVRTDRIWRDGSIRVMAGEGGSIHMTLPPEPVRAARHDLYGVVSGKCQDCHSTHYDAQTPYLKQGYSPEELNDLDDRALLATILKRGAAAKPTQGDEASKGAYVITRTSPGGPLRLRIFVSGRSFSPLSWQMTSGETTTTWRVNKRAIRNLEESPRVFFKDPTGLEPRSAQEIIIRTVGALRMHGSQGTVLKRTYSLLSGEEGHVEAKITAWTSADRRFERRSQVAYGSAADGESDKKTESTFYRNGRGIVVLTKSGGRLKKSYRDGASVRLTHGLLAESFSAKCQDCHSTDYSDGSYELLRSDLTAQVVGATMEQMLARLIETSDAQVSWSGDDKYALTIARPDLVSDLIILVRESDFSVVGIYSTGENSTRWELASSKTISASSLPKGFFKSPVPTKAPRRLHPDTQ